MVKLPKPKPIRSDPNGVLARNDFVDNFYYLVCKPIGRKSGKENHYASYLFFW